MTNKVLTDEQCIVIKDHAVDIQVVKLIEELLELRQQVKDKTQEAKDWRECADWFSQNFEGNTQKLDLYNKLRKKYPEDK